MTLNLKLRAYGRLFEQIDGSGALVISCALCNFRAKENKPPPGHRGREWGFKTMNRLRGDVMRHIQKEHPDDLEQAFRSMLGDRNIQTRLFV